MRAVIALVLVFSAARGQALTGSREVTGIRGGSVSVECSYEAEYRDSPKYWCRGPGWSCEKVVETSMSEREVRKDRVTIRDEPSTRTFTVVMEGLRPEDAGSYQCGIGRPVSLDPLFLVSVVVLTASSISPPTTISVKTASSLPTQEPSASSNVPSISSTETSGTGFAQSSLDPKTSELPYDHKPHHTRPHSLPRSSDWILHYLLPAGAFLLIILLLAAVLLIRSQRNKKKAFDRTSSLNNGTSQPPDQETAESQGLNYALIQFGDAKQQQDIYINMEVVRKDPSVECEYDTVRV
ncbi:CMRF35-like molecule 5 isoform X2 [Pleurodeles waltl]|uniref:CMRF35-like molecule 5 isoform X2 n=1 Tax=Pleurodeles waltl TaxID=8319 RepID=UPI00370957DD